MSSSLAGGPSAIAEEVAFAAHLDGTHGVALVVLASGAFAAYHWLTRRSEQAVG